MTDRLRQLLEELRQMPANGADRRALDAIITRYEAQDLMLAAAPEFAQSAKEADKALAAGETRSMHAVLSEMASKDDS